MKLSDKSLKILNLALNDGAIEGEWQAAAIRFISGLRKANVRIESFAQHQESRTHAADNGDFLMPFGKYKGKPITAADDGYIVWMFETMDLRFPLKDKVTEELERRGL